MNQTWPLLICSVLLPLTLAPCADSGAQGVHALLRMRQESPEAHLQDGRYERTDPSIYPLLGLCY